MWFRCSNCRKVHPTWRGEKIHSCGFRNNVKLTGERRKAKVGNAGNRNSSTVYRYQCLCCGHIGWSRHTDLQYLIATSL